MLRKVESTSDANRGPEPCQSGTALTFPVLFLYRPELSLRSMVQCEWLKDENERLVKETDVLKIDCQKLRQEHTLMEIFTFVSTSLEDNSRTVLSHFQQFLSVLMKLRLTLGIKI